LQQNLHFTIRPSQRPRELECTIFRRDPIAPQTAFTPLPDKAEIDDIADDCGKKLEEASISRVANCGVEAIAAEIAATYPFHPRLKNVIALFRGPVHQRTEFLPRLN
jgi:hypothetical protein